MICQCILNFEEILEGIRILSIPWFVSCCLSLSINPIFQLTLILKGITVIIKIPSFSKLSCGTPPKNNSLQPVIIIISLFLPLIIITNNYFKAWEMNLKHVASIMIAASFLKFEITVDSQHNNPLALILIEVVLSHFFLRTTFLQFA